MIERKERKPYWRHTKSRMLLSIVPMLGATVLVPFFAERLNGSKLLGFPLGYFLAVHGILALAVVIVAAFVNRQDAIDHWHGANEDL